MNVRGRLCGSSRCSSYKQQNIDMPVLHQVTQLGWESCARNNERTTTAARGNNGSNNNDDDDHDHDHDHDDDQDDEELLSFVSFTLVQTKLVTATTAAAATCDQLPDPNATAQPSWHCILSGTFVGEKMRVPVRQSWKFMCNMFRQSADLRHS